jgi:transcription elongation factor GreA
MKTIKTIPFTPDAYAKLQQNFDRLTKERVEVIIRLQTAREMGDLSENGAYIYAKRELGSIGRQLRELNYLLDNGFVQSTNSVHDRVEFGCQVTLKSDSSEITYLIVSKHESNPAERKLSTESPIGKAILNKKVGDSVEINIPAGLVKYQITKIQ